jgi:hypothetical protein
MKTHDNRPPEFDFGEGPVARHTDPQTSHNAAAAAAYTAQQAKERIKAILGNPELSPGGNTAPQIAAIMGVPRDFISPRFKELKKARIIFDTGRRRTPPGGNVRCIIWALRKT